MSAACSTVNSLPGNGRNEFYEHAAWWQSEAGRAVHGEDRFRLRMSDRPIAGIFNSLSYVLVMQRFQPWTDDVVALLMRLQASCFMCLFYLEAYPTDT